MILRDYQTAAVNALRDAFSMGSRAPCLAMPTGSGKTVCFAYISSEAAKRGTRVLILVHRRELLLQGSKALRECGVAHGIVAPGYPLTTAQVRIASVQSLVRRLGQTAPPNLVIVDEAHHATAGSWRTVRNAWPGALWLGVTATPARLDGTGLGEVFDRLVLGPSMKELVAAGHLAPCEVYAPPVVADLSQMKVIAGDFSTKDTAARMDKPKITGDCIAHYQRLGRGQRAIVFTATVDHAAHVADAFEAAGIPASKIDGGLDQETRDKVLARFRSGAVRVLTSCEILGEGFDCPDASVAILLRPTQSLTVYLQQVGRVMRPHGGEPAIILDHVGNTERHGLPEEDREWTLEGRKRRKGERAPPMSRCPVCFACFPLVMTDPALCPVCGSLLPRKEREPIESVDGELVKVQAKEIRKAQRREQGACETVEELTELGITRGYKNPRFWAMRVMEGRGR